MQLVLLFFSVAGYLYFFHIFAKCKLIQAPFYFSTVIIFLLYLFGITGHLDFGAYFCLILGLFLGAATVYAERAYYISKNFRSILTKNNLVEAFYLVPLLVVILSIPSAYQFMDWDEFSFWGLSIKIIATADTLYNASYPTEYNHYPPGQQLFQYFIIKFTGWSEKNALYSHVILCFSALLYVAGSFYKNANIKTVFLFFSACTFIYCFGFVYASVYSDKLVSFYFCAALVSAYFARNEVIQLIFLCLVIVTLVLIKQIGLLMSLLVVAVHCIANYPQGSRIKAYSTNPVIHYFYNYRFLVISIFCLVGSIYFSYRSWAWYVNSIGANKNYYSPGLLEFLEGERLQMLGAVLSEFVKRIQIPKFFVIGSFGLSLLNTTFIFLITSLIGISICERRKRIGFSIVLAIIFMGWIGYILFHLYAYQVFFGKWEALSLSSFERYAGIYCLSWMLFIYFAISNDLLRFKSKILSFFLVIFCCSTLLALYPKLRWDLGESFTTYNYDILQRINSDKAVVDAHVKREDSVYFISQGGTAYDRWAFYYAVYPKMKQFNPWSLCAKGDGYTCSYKSLSEALVGSNYLMLSKADDYFWQQAGHLFNTAEYGKKSGLYNVIYQDGIVVHLTRVDQ